MSNETKFTGGEWKINFTGPHWNNPDLRNIEITCSDIGECVCDTVYDVNDAHLIKTATKLYAEIEGDIKLFESMAEELGGDNGAILLELANVKRLLLAEARGES